jgi:hypothetical protein
MTNTELLELIDYMREETDTEKQITCLFDVVEHVLRELEGV